MYDNKNINKHVAALKSNFCSRMQILLGIAFCLLVSGIEFQVEVFFTATTSIRRTFMVQFLINKKHFKNTYKITKYLI